MFSEPSMTVSNISNQTGSPKELNPLDITARRSELCSRCRKIDFERLLVSSLSRRKFETGSEEEYEWPGINYDHRLGLRYFLDRFSKSVDCAICKVVRHLIYLQTQPGPFSLSRSVWRCRYQIAEHRSNYAYCSIEASDSSRKIAWGWPYCLEVRLSRRLRLGATSRDTNLVLCFQGAFLPSSPDLGFEEFLSKGSLSIEHFATGRVRPPLCDIRLFRAWLAKCEAEHAVACGFGDLRPILNLRLLNVKTKRVIAVAEEGIPNPPRYVALSYVWGGPQLVRLQKNNLERFGREGLSAERDLHPSIRDAIDVMQKLGETYLWVDALCIIQDDPVNVREQIAQMGQIYQAAVLTLIAAPDAPSSQCLPGISPSSSRQQQGVIRLENMALVTSATAEFSSTIEATEYSSWSTRAWTMQESLLSRRRLIFTQQQVHFACQTCDWCEDMHLESSVYKREREHTLVNQNELALSDASLLSTNDFMFEVAYQKLVREYSARCLTDEMDRFNAIQGILSVISERSQPRREFFWGIAVDAFEIQLCWSGDFDGDVWLSGKAGVMESLPCATASVPEFPSFSWLRWCSGISRRGLDGIKLGQANNVQPTVQCYTLHTENGRVFPQRISSSKIADAPWIMGPRDISEQDVHSALRQDAMPYANRFCLFWTSSVEVSKHQIQASKLPKLHFRFHRSRSGGTRELEVYMWDWNVDLATDVAGEHELITLGWHLEGIGATKINDMDRIGAYVLLVRKEPRNGTVRRVGLGEVDSIEQWMAVKPSWKLVVLD